MSGTMRKGVVAAAAVVAGLSTGVVGSVALTSVPALAVEEETTPVAIAEVQVSGSYTYNGESHLDEVEDAIVLKDVDGNTIEAEKDTDYTVSVEGDDATIKNAGNYSVTVAPVSGSKVLTGASKTSKTFKVAPKDAKISIKNQSIPKGNSEKFAKVQAAVSDKSIGSVSGFVSGDAPDVTYKIQDENEQEITSCPTETGSFSIVAVLAENANPNYKIEVTEGTLTVVDPESPFIDTPSGTPHRDDILWLYANDISVGWTTDAGLEFRGMNQVLRQDMAAFLYRVARGTASTSDLEFTEAEMNAFTDVDETTPHYKEILWCAKKGIVKGYGSGVKREFRGTSAVIRQDMAAFLYRAQYIKQNPNAESIPDATADGYATFDDVDSETPHAKEIETLAQGGENAVIRGWKNADGTKEFRGTQPVVRQDMAAFLHRIGAQA